MLILNKWNSNFPYSLFSQTKFPIQIKIVSELVKKEKNEKERKKKERNKQRKRKKEKCIYQQ